MSNPRASLFGDLKALPVYRGWSEPEIESNVNEVLNSGDPARKGKLVSLLAGSPAYGKGWTPEAIEKDVRYSLNYSDVDREGVPTDYNEFDRRFKAQNPKPTPAVASSAAGNASASVSPTGAGAPAVMSPFETLQNDSRSIQAQELEARRLGVVVPPERLVPNRMEQAQRETSDATHVQQQQLFDDERNKKYVRARIVALNDELAEMSKMKDFQTNPEAQAYYQSVTGELAQYDPALIESAVKEGNVQKTKDFAAKRLQDVEKKIADQTGEQPFAIGLPSYMNNISMPQPPPQAGSSLGLQKKLLEEAIAHPNESRGAIKDLGSGLFSEVKAENIPFLGTAIDVANHMAIKSAAEKPEAERSHDEKALIDAYAAVQQVKNNSEFTPILYDVGKGAAAMIPYAAEFGMTGGVYNLAKNATQRGIMSIVGKAATRDLLEAAAKRQMIGVAEKYAIKGASSVVGGVVQSLANPLRIVDDFETRTIPEMTFTTTPQGEIAERMVKGSPDTEATAFLKSLGMNASEFVSERWGILVEKPVDFIAKKAFGRYFMKRGITATDEMLDKVAARANWNGILGEFFEEYANAPVQSWIEKGKPELMGGREALTTLGVVALPGMAGKALRQTMRGAATASDYASGTRTTGLPAGINEATADLPPMDMATGQPAAAPAPSAPVAAPAVPESRPEKTPIDGVMLDANGEKVNILSRNGDIVNVEYEDGQRGTGNVNELRPYTEKHEEIAKAAAVVNTAPTPAQKEAGNYQKGHVTVNGLDVSIENPKGSVRSGKDKDGETWESEMKNHYGYIRRTEGADGDQVDVFLGDEHDAPNVYIVDQQHSDTGKFDEHKVMMGFQSEGEAVRAYNANYSDDADRIQNVTEMPIDEFKTWLKTDESKRPAAEYKAPQAETNVPEPETNVPEPETIADKTPKAIDMLKEDTGADNVELVPVPFSDEAKFKGNISIRKLPNGKYTSSISFKGKGVIVGESDLTIEHESRYDAIQAGITMMHRKFIDNGFKTGKHLYELGEFKYHAADHDPNKKGGDSSGLQTNTQEGRNEEGQVTPPAASGSKAMAELDKSGPDFSAAKDPEFAQSLYNGIIDGISPQALPYVRHDHEANRSIENSNKFIDIIDGKDYEKLTQRLHMGNPASRKAFERRTGLKLPKNVKGTQAVIDQYVGEEVVGKYRYDETMRRVEREKAEKKAADDKALAKRIAWTQTDASGNAVKKQGTKRDFIDHAISEGFTKVTTGRKGAFPTVRLENAKGSFYEFTSGAEQRYVKEAIDAHAMKYERKVDDILAKHPQVKVIDKLAPADLVNMPFGIVTPSAAPLMTLTGGLSGAGKSIGLTNDIREKSVEINSDIMKPYLRVPEETPENGNALHAVSSHIANAQLQRALDEKYNVIYDSTLSDYARAKRIVEKTLENEGTVHIMFTDVDAETSQARSRAREISGAEKRHVPVATTVKGYNHSLPAFIQLYQDYKGNKNVSFSLTSNNVDFQPAKKIFSRINGKLNIIDQAGLDSILSTPYHKEEGGTNYVRNRTITVDELAAASERIEDRAKRIVERNSADVAWGSESENVPAEGTVDKKPVRRKGRGSSQTDSDAAVIPSVPTESADPRLKELEDGFDAAIASMAKSYGQLNSGISPEQIVAGVKVVEAGIKLGHYKFSDLIRALLKKLPHDFLRKIIDGIKSAYGTFRISADKDTRSKMSSMDEVEDFDIEALIKEESNVTSTREPSSIPLEGIQPDNVSPVSGGGNTPGEGGGSGRIDESGTGEPDAAGSGTGNSLADGEGEPYNPPTGTGADGSTGAGAVTDRPDIQPAPIDQPGDAGNTEPGYERPGPVQSGPPANYVITDSDRLGKGTLGEKWNDNIAALKVLNTLKEEGRDATPEEKAKLVRYIGWGGMKAVFPRRDGSFPSSGNWEARHAELKSLISPEEYEAAARSTQDAHYTAEPIVKAMYDIFDHLGFRGGKFLESSMGTGNFFGLMPMEMRGRSELTGVEQDRITGAIAKQLYPNANVLAPMGFQDAPLSDAYFDASGGNPPFGSQPIPFGLSKHLKGFSIHNYFFARIVDKLRPGGVMVNVITNSFLDKGGEKERNYIAERVKFLGAIRLPNTAFQENANTEVTTDIVILQKLPESEFGTADKSWVGTGTIPDPLGGPAIPLNQYFINHPEMMLGKMERSGKMRFNADGTLAPALVPIEGDHLPTLISEAIKRLPAGVYNQDGQVARNETVNSRAIEGPEETANHSIDYYFVPKDKDIIYQRVQSDDGSMKVIEITADTPWSPKQKWGVNRVNRLRKMLDIRDAVLRQYDLERNEGSEEAMDANRAELNTLYDNFVREYGYLHSYANSQAIGDDRKSLPLLMSIEKNYDAGISTERAARLKLKPQKATAQKMDVFTKRVIPSIKRAVTAANSVDALNIVLNEDGRIDLDRMASLTGISRDTIIKELTDGEDPLLFMDPARDEYVLKDEYLAGNVKAKAKAAEMAGLSKNRQALEAVFPPDAGPSNIAMTLKTPWVKPKYFQDFINQLLGAGTRSEVVFLHNVGGFVVSVRPGNQTENNTTYGTEFMGADKIIERLMNSKDLVIRTEMDDGSKRVDVEATIAVQQKADRIVEAFTNWIFKDVDRREDLVKFYNDNINVNVEPKINGSHLTLPGKVPDTVIRLNPHQKNAAWRIIRSSDYSTLLDHAVGSGKSFTMIASAMEMKRLGLAKKSLFVVPNHLVPQWTEEFYRLYPGANILPMKHKDFEKQNRRETFARIAAGDWDAVIIAHSSFNFIPVDRSLTEAHIEGEIKAMEETKAQMEAAEGKKSATVSSVQKAIEAKRAKLAELLDSPTDDVLKFEEMGIDQLFVDEAHEFKNLFFTTQNRTGRGFGNPNGSKKAMNLFIKVKYLSEKRGGRGVVFATGTPISNSLSEMYTMQRYLGMKDLQRQGINSFDTWLNTYGDVSVDYELDGTGVKYKQVSRLRQLQNMPTLMAMYKQFTDSVTNDQLMAQYRRDNNGKDYPIPEIEDGKPILVVVPRSAHQAAYFAEIVHRAENLDPKDKTDNMLAITMDARKAALDMRIHYPQIPDDPNSKAAICAKHVYENWVKWKKKKGTQLVFLDLSVPSKHAEADFADIKKLLAAAEGGDEDAQAKLDKKSPDDLEAAKSALGGFSVYDDLRLKLMALGIPEKEIAFIHDANTDVKKADLFAQVNAGKVRVLLGSTSRMGAGMNVQKLLVALHHLDCPWRPSDIEQREGRIIRQGNDLYFADPKGFRIRIYRYATETTYDARMWQVQEQKALGIQGTRDYHGQDTMEDVSAAAASAAEMKAEASGNPLILEDVQLAASIRKLEAKQKAWNSDQYDYESKLRKYTQALETLPAKIPKLISDADAAERYSENPTKGHEVSGTVNGETIKTADAAKEAAYADIKKQVEAQGITDEYINDHQARKTIAEKELYDRNFKTFLASKGITPAEAEAAKNDNSGRYTDIVKGWKEWRESDDAEKLHFEPLKRGKWKINVNGTDFTSRETLISAIEKYWPIGEKFGMEFKGKSIPSIGAADDAVLNYIREEIRSGRFGTTSEVGHIGDFAVSIGMPRSDNDSFAITLQGEENHTVFVNYYPNALESTARNIVSAIAKAMKGGMNYEQYAAQNQLKNAKADIENVQKRVSQEGFEGSAELERMRARHAVVRRELSQEKDNAPKGGTDEAPSMLDQYRDGKTGSEARSASRSVAVRPNLLFYRFVYGSEYEHVKNAKLVLLEGTDNEFFSYLNSRANPKEKWNIVEAKTGLPVGSGETRAKAIESAQKAIDNFTDANLQKKVKEHVAQYGASPRYPDEQKPDARQSIRAMDMLNRSDELIPQGRPAESLSSADVTSMQKTVNELTQWMKKAPEIVVVKDRSSLPEPLRRAFVAESEAILWNQKDGKTQVYVVAGNIADKTRLQAVLLHEIVGHYGLVHTLGPSFENFLERVYNDFAYKIEKQDWYADYVKEGNDVNTKSGRATMAAEFLAHEAENPMDPSLWDRVVLAFKTALRSIGLQIRLSMADIRDTITASKNYVAGKWDPDPTPGGTESMMQSIKVPNSARDVYDIGSTGSFVDNLKSRWDKVKSDLHTQRRKFQDHLIDLKKMQDDAILRGSVVPDWQNAYQKETLSYGRIEHQLGQFVERFTEPIRRQLAEARDNAKVTLGDVRWYLYAKHAPERNAWLKDKNQGLIDALDAKILNSTNAAHIQRWENRIKELENGSGMSDESAKQILADLQAEGKIGELEKVAKIFYEMNKFDLKRRLEGELITREYYDELMDRFKYYMTLQGFEETEDDHSIARTGRGFDIRGKEYKESKGRRSMAGDILSYSIMQAEAGIIRAEKNKVQRAFYDFVSANASPDYEILPVYYLAKTNTLTKGDKFDEDTGLQEYELKWGRPTKGEWESGKVLMKLDPDKHMLSDFDFSKLDDENIVAVKIKGKNKYIKLKDPNLAQALKKMNIDRGDWLVKISGKFVSGYRKMATQYNPEFAVSNFIRDLGEAVFYLNAEVGVGASGKVVSYLPAALNGLRTAIHGNKNSEWGKAATEFFEEGAATGYWNLRSIEERTKALVKAFDPNIMQSVGHKLGKALEFIDEVNRVVENGVRLATYYHLTRDRKWSKEDAAAYAKNMTVNFNRHGEKGSVMSQIYVFFNASVQGTARLAQTMFSSNPKIRRRALLEAALIFGTGSIFQYFMRLLMGQDPVDETYYYDKINPWTKNHKIVIPKMWTDDPTDIITIPLPYGLNIFWALSSAAGDMATGQFNANSALSLGGAAVDAFSPYGSAESNSALGTVAKTVLPTFARPAAELLLNEDFRGQRIYKEQDQYSLTQRPNSEMYYKGVTPAIRDATTFLNSATGGNKFNPGWLDLNPEIVDYLGTYYTAGVGRFIKGVINTGAQAIDPNASIEWGRAPFVRVFNSGISPSVDEDRYRSAAGKYQVVENELKYYLRTGDMNNSRTFIENKEPLLLLNEQFDEVQRLGRLSSELKKANAPESVQSQIDDALKTGKKKFVRDVNKSIHAIDMLKQ